MKRLAVIACLLSLASCLSAEQADSRARDRIEASGFRDVVMTGEAPVGCIEGDEYRLGFTATRPDGLRVSGVVCGSTFGEPWTVRVLDDAGPPQ